MIILPIRRRGASLFDPGGQAARSCGCTCDPRRVGHMYSLFGLERCPLHNPRALAVVTGHDRRVVKNLSFMA